MITGFIFKVVELIGAVFLLLYGMKVMSDSLQKLSGKKMRLAVEKFTNTRLSGFFSGFFLTSLLQTSSGATLLFVGLVNSGIVTFLNSIPLIIGANVGTTLKMWFISYLGFHFDIGRFILFFIAFSFPFLLSKKLFHRSIGEFFIGFSLLFIGLHFMKNVFPSDIENSFFYQISSNISNKGYSSILLFALLGFIITAILQSSSATLAFTFVLCYHNVISLPYAFAMVIGENVGTTITANIGAILANRDAKRAAFIHFFMNFFTAIIVLPFVLPLSDLLKNFFLKFSIDLNNSQQIPLGLTFIHTSFNLLLTLIMLPSTEILKQIACYVIPNKQQENSGSKNINTNLVSTPDIAIIQIKKQMLLFAKDATRSIKLNYKLFQEKKEKKFEETFNEIQIIEQFIDLKFSEFNENLKKLSEKDLQGDSALQLYKMIEIIDTLENITDFCFELANVIKRKNEKNIWFNQNMRDDVNELFENIVAATEVMNDNLLQEPKLVSIDEAKKIEDKINNLFTEYRNKQNSYNIDKEVPFESYLFLEQIISQIERIADEIYRVTKIITSIR